MHYINGNTGSLHRLTREINAGKRAVDNCNDTKVKERRQVNITYYLLNDGRVITYREWCWENKPGYKLNGSLDGIEKHLKRVSNDR